MINQIDFRIWINNDMIYLPFAGIGYYDFEGSYAMSFAVDGYSEFWAHENYTTKSKEVTNKAIIMQKTGLKDMHNKDKYVGDIILYNEQNRIFVIEFTKGAFWEVCVNDKEFGKSLVTESLGEVIGNIYQSPELIK